MTLYLHRNSSPARLADNLAEWLAQAPLGVFESELVVVASAGVERWLAQRLSHRLGAAEGVADDGVTAGLEVRSPGSLISLLLDREFDDPWSLERFTWAVLDAMDAVAGRKGFEALTRHIGADGPPEVAGAAAVAGAAETPGIRGKDGTSTTTSTDPAATFPESEAWLRRVRQSRRYATARRLAGLFIRYTDERPDLVRAWARGEAPPACAGLDAGAEDLTWQATLWRESVARVIATTDADVSAIERHDAVLRALRRGEVPPQIPSRINLFGQTQLSRSTLELLQALSAHRDVHLWLPHPSPQLWSDLEPLLGLTCGNDVGPGGHAVDSSPSLRAADESHQHVRHPLLASLGRDARELQASLARVGVVSPADGDASADACSADEAPVTWQPRQFVSHPHASATGQAPTVSRLAQLQDDIRANRPPTSWVLEPGASTDKHTAPTPRDLSLQVHACHGPARSVEAMRETLLWLLDPHGPGLQPRDIIVMCPDVETYAPLIKAAFSQVSARSSSAHLWGDDELTVTSAHPAQELWVQLADRGMAQTNPLAAVAISLLTLVAGRMTSTEVIDFASHPCVARRFGFDAEDLERITSWVEASGARWGRDAGHRNEYGLADVTANTWDQAADRLALGVAVAQGTPSGIAVRAPLDDITHSDITTVSAFLELLDDLQRAASHIRGRSTADPSLPAQSFTPHEWFEWVRDLTLSLTETEPLNAWQKAQFEREMNRLIESATHAKALRLTDVRLLMESRWAPRPTRQNFRNGAASVCTMTPMRSVPHAAVIMLGLDDGVVPRNPVPDGDDILARCPVVGERDVRSEDRQLILDAIMAASEYFIAFYSGFDERTGERRPACVPIQELMATASRTGGITAPADAPTPDAVEAAVAAGVLHEHPLQPFDERNFELASPLPGGSFDSHSYDGAVALRTGRAAATRPPVLAELSLPPVSELDNLTLDDLLGFLRNPAQTFCRKRLDITVPREHDELSTGIPIELNALERWKIGDELLTCALSGESIGHAVARLRASGLVPPGPLANSLDRTVLGPVSKILNEIPPNPAATVDISLDVPLAHSSRTVRLSGVVSGVRGHELTVATFASVNAKHLMNAWLRLLTLSVHEPEHAWSARIIGGKNTVRLRAVDPAESRSFLSALVAMYNEGLTSVMLHDPKTSHAYTDSYRRAMRTGRITHEQAHDRALHAARNAWEGTFDFPGSNADRWWLHVLGSRVTIQDVDRLPRPAGASFAETARRLWIPVFDHLGEA